MINSALGKEELNSVSETMRISIFSLTILINIFILLLIELIELIRHYWHFQASFFRKCKSILFTVIIFQIQQRYFCDFVFYFVNWFKIKTVFWIANLFSKFLIVAMYSSLVWSPYTNSNVNSFSLNKFLIIFSLFTIGIFNSFKISFTLLTTD